MPVHSVCSALKNGEALACDGGQSFGPFKSNQSGSEKGVSWKRGLFRKVHFLEILENLEILEIEENPQAVENEGEAGNFLEILENLD